MGYQTLTKHSLDKLPPHDLDAEQAILGALLLDVGKLPDVLRIISPEDFYRPSHRKIFEAIQDVGDDLDLIVLRNRLQQQRVLDDVGGAAYLAALADVVPTAANIVFHATLVREKSLTRTLLNNAVELATRAYDDTESARTMIQDARDRFTSLWRMSQDDDWHFWESNGVGAASGIESDRYLEFLIQEFGFYMIELNGVVLFVQNQKNILTENVWVKSTNKTIKDALKYYCQEQRRPDVWRLLVNKNKLFTPAMLTGLDTLPGDFYRDQQDTCSLFFQNGVIEITASRITWKPYTDVNGYLWEDQISEHAYSGRCNRQYEDRIRTELHAAMKARQKIRVNVLRLMLSALQHFRKDYGTSGDPEFFNIVDVLIDNASEAMQYALQANRPDLIAQYDEELKILNEYYDWKDQRRSEYQRFLELVSSEDIEDYNGKIIHVNNLHAFEYAVAYLIHGYNSKANMRAVVLADSNPSFVANGRRGKGVILQAMKYIKGKGIVVKEDGKAFDNKQFKFQLVRPNTRVLILDDVPENFDFTMLFSAITDVFVVESKGISRIAFEFEDIPRIAITTNHPCYDEGVSSSDRSLLLPVADYFVKNGKTPYQVFGHMLFDDWDRDEWDRFFDYIIEITQRFLQRPDPSVVPEVDLSIFNANKLLLRVPEPMVNYLDSLQIDKDYEHQALITELTTLGLNFRTTNEFNRLLHTYCRLRGYKLKTNTKDGRYISNNIQYVCIQPTTPDMFDVKWKKPKL